MSEQAGRLRHLNTLSQYIDRLFLLFQIQRGESKTRGIIIFDEIIEPSVTHGQSLLLRFGRYLFEIGMNECRPDRHATVRYLKCNSITQFFLKQSTEMIATFVICFYDFADVTGHRPIAV